MSAAALPALIDRLLLEQQETAAARFAQAHDEAEAAGPALAGRYSALMPATPPAAGQQYAFDVDLDAWLRLQVVRRGVPCAERPRGGGVVARRGAAARRKPEPAHDAACHDRVSPLPRPGLHARVPRRRLREGSGDGASSSISTTSASGASTARWPVRTTRRSTATPKGSSASATCAAIGWRRAKPRPASSRVRTAPSRFAWSTSSRSSRNRRPTCSSRGRRSRP